MNGRIARRDVLKGGAGIMGLGLVSGFGGLAKAADGPVKVNILNATGSFASVKDLIFKDRKYFEKYGVAPELIYLADGSKILAGLLAGDGDICPATGFSGVFPAVEKGAKLKIIAGSGIAPVSILYSTKPEIKTVKDLVGRTVGVGAPGTLLHQLTVAVMKKYGIDYTKVNFVNIGSITSVYQALAAGTVDAGVGPIEFRDQAARNKIYPLADGEFYKELPLYTNQAMMATDKVIAEKRDALVRVLAAHADMFRWIQNPASKDAFIGYYKEALGKNASDEESVFFQDFLSKPGRLATDLVLSEDQINYVQNLNIELGQQKTVLPFNQVADMSLAQEALKLLKA